MFDKKALHKLYGGGSVLLMLLMLWLNGYARATEPCPWKNPHAELSILLFGDTNIQNRENPTDAFRYLLPTLLDADLRIGNLEGLLCGSSKDPHVPDIPHKPGWKHSEPEMVKALIDAQFDAVAVASNVSWPWPALMKSLALLDEHGIRYAGGGENLDAAHRPVILQKNGVRVGFLSYACTVFPYLHAADESTPGIAALRVDTWYKPPRNLDKPGTPMEIMTIPVEADLQRMTQDIRALKEQTDVVICSYHWGRSFHTELIDYQIALAHAAIDAGADVIMGHGNHELGAIEVYRDKPIFYGLGNFVFDWEKMFDRSDGLLAKIDLKAKRMTKVSVAFLRQNDDKYSQLLDPNIGAGAELFQMLKYRSAGRSHLVVEDKAIVVEPLRNP